MRVVEIKGDFVALGSSAGGQPDDGPAHREFFVPPVPMGVSTSNTQKISDNNCAFGTLGFRVLKTATGEVGYVT